MESIFDKPIPRLGFGCMRLPEGQDGEYIVEECQQMFDYAMAHGITYFDSAWHYIENQLMIGKCLSKYPRESYVLVGKLFFNDGTINTWEKAEAAFQKELSDARVAYNDLELLHAVGSEEAKERIDRMDAWGFMRSLKESGRVKHIGMSFHGTAELLDRVLTEHPELEVIQLQTNYFDHFTNSRHANGGGLDVYDVARKHGKPIIVMEPVKGGNLAQVDQHPEIKALFEAADPSMTPASWALRYAASMEGVMIVLSGMSNMEQMEQNVKLMQEGFQPLTEADKEMLKKAAEIIESKQPVGCTGCRYCVEKGCPAGIRIPQVLKSLNMLHQYQNIRGARMEYYGAISEHRPTECIRCGSCERECPQSLPIRDLIREADDRLYAGPNYDVWANH